MRVIGQLLADRAARHPDRTFLRWQGADLSYAEATELTHRHANAFLASGVRRGDHVALFLDNHPDFLWCLWGLGTIGAVAVPLNTAARGDMLHYYLAQSEDVLLTWALTAPLPIICVAPAAVLGAPRLIAAVLAFYGSAGFVPLLFPAETHPCEAVRAERAADLTLSPATP